MTTPDRYTVSGDVQHYYVSNEQGHIVATVDDARDAERIAEVLNKCPTCRGSGRVGPDVKKESPVAPGLMIWTPQWCPDCDGQGDPGRRERTVTDGSDNRVKG